MLNIVLAMLLGAALAQEEPAPTIADLEAQALYKLGLELIAAEQWDQACAALTRVWIDHPHHELAMLAREKTHWIADAQKGSTCRQHSTVAPSEAPNSGRTELVVSQAIVGPITLGVLVPLTVPPLGETTTVPVLLGLTGLGLGIGGTYAITEKHPVTTGQAMAIGTGEMVGALNGLGMATLFVDDNDFFQPWGGVLGGTVLGGGLAVAAAVAAKPTAGQMSVVRSGATWGAYLGAVSFTFVPAVGSTADLNRVVLATDVGMVTGMVIAANYDPGRGRMNVINLAGYAGTLVTGGILLIAGQNGNLSPGVTGSGLLIGAGGGMAIGGLLTSPARSSDLGWTVGGPPMILPHPDGVQAFAPLVQGRF